MRLDATRDGTHIRRTSHTTHLHASHETRGARLRARRRPPARRFRRASAARPGSGALETINSPSPHFASLTARSRARSLDGCVVMFPSWLASSSDEYSEDEDATKPRAEGSSKLRAIGSCVKHEAKESLEKLARSSRASAAVDEVTKLLTDPEKHAAREKVEEIKRRSQTLWATALRNKEDEEKIQKAKRGASRALEITEKLALSADPNGEVAHTFADAARALKGILEGSKNREEALEQSKTLGKDVWEKLSTKAKGNDHFSGMKGTVERIVERVKGLMEKLKEEKLKRDEAAAISSVLNAGHQTSEEIDSRLKTLTEESKDVWSDLRADGQLKALMKEEIIPGFERLIRGAVQVSCELMSSLELPRVDGVYDSPIGSVCYHVDNLRFTEFHVEKESLRVINHMDEDDEGAGLSTTVEVTDITTVMSDVEFAYCEFPRNWGVVDGEGLCSVTVEGASVGITYEIIINTNQLLKLVNQGVELAKDETKLAETREKIELKLKERKQAKEQEAKRKASEAPAKVTETTNGRNSLDSVQSEEFGSPRAQVDALGSALDKAFGANMFADAPADMESPPMSPTSPTFHDATDDAQVLNAEQKLARNRKVVGDILGDEFLGEEPVLELRVHTTHIHIGDLDVQISGTSAAWLYNMIALVLSQQLRGTIEEKINNITVKQLARVSGAVAAYSAGLIEVSVYHEESDDEYGSMLSGVTGSLRENPGKWGEDWRCSHCPGEAPEHVEARRKFGSRSQSKSSFGGMDELVDEVDKLERAAAARQQGHDLEEDVDWHDIASPM